MVLPALNLSTLDDGILIIVIDDVLIEHGGLLHGWGVGLVKIADKIIVFGSSSIRNFNEV